jgi:hypothetical protein
VILSQVVSILIEAGANEREAADLADVMFINGWDQIRHDAKVEDARTWLADWRDEKRVVAASVRQDRQRKLDVGMFSVPVAAPVNLGGRTEW